MDSWKKALNDLFNQKEKEKELARERAKLELQRYKCIKNDVIAFLTSTIVPVFEELEKELAKHNREVQILQNFGSEFKDDFVEIVVEYDNSIDDFQKIEQFSYKVICSKTAEVLVDIKYMENEIIKEEYRNCFIKDQGENTIYAIMKNDIIDSFMFCYEKYI